MERLIGEGATGEALEWNTGDCQVEVLKGIDINVDDSDDSGEGIGMSRSTFSEEIDADMSVDVDEDEKFCKDIIDSDDDGLSSSPSSQSSLSSMDEEELELVIDLIEGQIESEGEFMDGVEDEKSKGCNDNDNNYDCNPAEPSKSASTPAHFVEYWSVGKRGNPRTLLRKYPVSVNN